MTRETKRMAWGASALAVLALLAACVSRESETPDRLAALEARIARLEAALGASDAGVSVADASLAMTVEEKSRHTTIVSGDAMAEAFFDEDGGSCLANADRVCQKRAASSRVKVRTSPDASVEWGKTEPLQDASATPAGRACLQAEHVRCKRELEEHRKLVRQVQWFDAQLVADNLDARFTAAARARLEARTGPLGDALDLKCTAQFCRIALRPGKYAADVSHIHSFIDGISGSLGPGTGATYLFRNGFQPLDDDPPRHGSPRVPNRNWGKLDAR